MISIAEVKRINFAMLLENAYDDGSFFDRPRLHLVHHSHRKIDVNQRSREFSMSTSAQGVPTLQVVRGSLTRDATGHVNLVSMSRMASGVSPGPLRMLYLDTEQSPTDHALFVLLMPVSSIRKDGWRLTTGGMGLQHRVAYDRIVHECSRPETSPVNRAKLP
nr:hypothetical protein CFP56_30139 [Quercus suber]